MSDDVPNPDLNADNPVNPFVRFPEMTPVASMPTLWTVNTVGLTLVGARDHDEETGSYVKTHAVCVFFIPLIAIGAYRVWDLPHGGWECIGRVPLSRFARVWNWVFLLLIVCGIGGGVYARHVNSPEYRAGVELARADKFAEEGREADAAVAFGRLAVGPPTAPTAVEARKRLAAMVANPPADPAKALAVFRAAAALPTTVGAIPDLYARAVKVVEASAADSPAAALELYEVVEDLAPKAADRAALRVRLLEKMHAAAPKDVAVAVKLATEYDTAGDSDRAAVLLEPFKDNLGSTEGAAILGRAFARQGRADLAESLLRAYVRAGVPRLRATFGVIDAAYKEAQRDVFGEAFAGRIPGLRPDELQHANEQRRAELIRQFLVPRLNVHPRILALKKDQESIRGVIPAVLDFGSVLMQRAQQVGDLNERRAMLAEAEQAFKDIAEEAGESEMYKTHLAQVYHWMGRDDEGKKILDAMLKSDQKRAATVSLVSATLREVGAVSEARKALEAAYAKETNEQEKFMLAASRWTMGVDLDDQIEWLRKADPNADDIKVGLAKCLGQKAAEDGKDDEALRHYQDALDIYAKMPENPATLNNSALVHFARFAITQDREDHRKGTERLDRAVALRPGDSILLHNVANRLVESLCFDVVGDGIDWKATRHPAGLELLDHFYKDQPGRRALAAKLAAHPARARALAVYDKLLLLAPKRPDAYSALMRLHGFAEDGPALKALADRLGRTTLDQEVGEKRAKEYLEGKRDEKYVADAERAIRRSEEALARARKIGGRTLSVAASDVLDARRSLAAFGKDIDLDAQVKLAEESFKANDSADSRSDLGYALLMRAHRSLSKADPAYKAQADKTARSLGPHLVIWVLWRDGPLREKAMADADVRRYAALQRERADAYPDLPRATTWAVLSAADPARAEKMAKVLSADPKEVSAWKIMRALSPFSAATAAEEAYSLSARGKGDEAEQLLNAVAARGVPLPE